MEQQKCIEETMESENPPGKPDQPVWSEHLRGDLQGNSEKSQPIDETKDDAEARNDFWSIEGDFICRLHVEPRIQLLVPKEETFPIPVKYIDVTRSTHTNLDASQESRVDDSWNVDVDRSLSDSWTGITRFTPPYEKLPKGFMWSSEPLTEIQATARPDYLWLVMRSAQKKEKHQWTIEKKNARQCSETERHRFCRSGRWRVQGNHKKRKEEVRDTDGGRHAL